MNFTFHVLKRRGRGWVRFLQKQFKDLNVRERILGIRRGFNGNKYLREREYMEQDYPTSTPLELDSLGYVRDPSLLSPSPAGAMSPPPPGRARAPYVYVYHSISSIFNVFNFFPKVAFKYTRWGEKVVVDPTGGRPWHG